LATNSLTLTTRSKPTGVIGCEVIQRISNTQLLDSADYQLVGLWTRFSEAVEFNTETPGTRQLSCAGKVAVPRSLICESGDIL